MLCLQSNGAPLNVTFSGKTHSRHKLRVIAVGHASCRLCTVPGSDIFGALAISIPGVWDSSIPGVSDTSILGVSDTSILGV